LYEVGGGTGFFVHADGYLVTNKHVVEDPAATYTVVTSQAEEYPAKVLARDLLLDLAVLRVEGEGPFPAVAFGDASSIRVGQTVIAIGNTLSAFPNTVTKGIVSGIDRTIVASLALGSEEVIRGAIQTDAAISEGNSGGPLINLLGEVIGINTAVSKDGQSLGFAIPVKEVIPILKDVREHGRIIRPWLGVRYVTLNPTWRERYGLSVQEGAFIPPEDSAGGLPAVLPGSPAARAGLRALDVIVRVGDVTLSDKVNLSDAIQAFEPGDVLELEVMRDGERRVLTVELAELGEEDRSEGG
jgi:S1-C subfamily serine protease